MAKATWEYLVFDRSNLAGKIGVHSSAGEDAVALEACLNRHGEIGWELVSIEGSLAVMKRRQG